MDSRFAAGRTFIDVFAIDDGFRVGTAAGITTLAALCLRQDVVFIDADDAVCFQAGRCMFGVPLLLLLLPLTLTLLLLLLLLLLLCDTCPYFDAKPAALAWHNNELLLHLPPCVCEGPLRLHPLLRSPCLTELLGYMLIWVVGAIITAH